MKPVHQRCPVKAGVYLIENLVMDDLVRHRVSTFCFILLPVKLLHATGSPVRPIAMIRADSAAHALAFRIQQRLGDQRRAPTFPQNLDLEFGAVGDHILRHEAERDRLLDEVGIAA